MGVQGQLTQEMTDRIIELRKEEMPTSEIRHKFREEFGRDVAKSTIFYTCQKAGISTKTESGAGRPKEIPQEILSKIKQLKEEGLSYVNIRVKIEEEFGRLLAGSTIYRVLNPEKCIKKPKPKSILKSNKHQIESSVLRVKLKNAAGTITEAVLCCLECDLIPVAKQLNESLNMLKKYITV